MNLIEDKEVYETIVDGDGEPDEDLIHDKFGFTPSEDDNDMDFVKESGAGWKARELFESHTISPADRSGHDAKNLSRHKRGLQEPREGHDSSVSETLNEDEMFAIRINRFIEAWNDLKDPLQSKLGSSSILEHSKNDLDVLEHQLRHIHTKTSSNSREALKDIQGRLERSFQDLSMSSKLFCQDQTMEQSSPIPCIDQTSNKSDQLDMLEIENRLIKLENLLGIDQISYECPPILEQLDLIESQLNYLDPKKLEFVSSRLKDLDQHLEHNKHQLVSDVPLDMTEKIEKIYEQLPLIDYALRTFPPLIDRLNSIKRMFYEVSSFGATIQSIATDQEVIKDTLYLQQHKLNSLEHGVKDTLETMFKNAEQLQKQFEEIHS